MDPATAFSIACATFQLAELCIKTTSSAYEICTIETSLTRENERVEQEATAIGHAATSVSEQLTLLRSIGSRLTKDQLRLQNASTQCLNFASELRDILDRLKAKISHKKAFHIAAKAFQSVNAKAKIKLLQAKLKEWRRVLDTELLVSLLYVPNFLTCTKLLRE